MTVLIFLCIIWIGDAIYGLAVNQDMYSFQAGGRTTNIISLVVSGLLLPVLLKIHRVRAASKEFDFLYEHNADFREQADLNSYRRRAEFMKAQLPDAFNTIISTMRSTENHTTRREELREARPDWSEDDIDTVFVASFLQEKDRADKASDEDDGLNN